MRNRTNGCAVKFKDEDQVRSWRLADKLYGIYPVFRTRKEAKGWMASTQWIPPGLVIRPVEIVEGQGVMSDRRRAKPHSRQEAKTNAWRR